ncbi:beta-ketoacyl synthase N-terminal-like domain-containing protein, partial [Accumulibacter sp.]
MASRRVVVTGLGIVSPVGNTVEEAWQNVLAGRSGIGRITRFDASSFPVQIAGEVKGFEIGTYLSPKEARRMDVFIHYGMAAGIQAIRDAGLEVGPPNAERIGLSIGSGIGGLPMIESTCDDFAAGGVRKISPFFVPGSIINMISGNLSIMYGYKGPNLSLVSACATGTHSIGDAGRLISHGDADIMIAGGAEGCVSKLGLGGFCAPRALSTRND